MNEELPLGLANDRIKSFGLPSEDEAWLLALARNYDYAHRENRKLRKTIEDLLTKERGLLNLISQQYRA